MIGVIGPADSTGLARSVAADIGLAESLVVTPYQSPSETVDLVHSLSDVCPAILFTGRLPYCLAVANGFHATGFEYIPHEGTDLFRVLNMLALSESYRGRIPRLSFDSMPENGVAEAYAELGVEYTCRVIPLEIPAEAGTISTERIIASHQALYETGDVEHCATCISSVFAALDAARVPVIRVGHSRMSVRQALLRAQLLLELDRAEASQVAVGLLCRVAAAAKKRRRGSLSLPETLRLCAQRLGGRVMRKRAKEGSVLTTRGSVERALKLMSIISSDGQPKDGLVLGIGTGATAENAEGRAREACERARSGRQNLIRFAEDVVVPYALVHSVQAREIRRGNVERRRDLQVSATVLRRLGLIFRELDPAGFTAEELARGYNIQPRSARRLIALLRTRGLVQECGLEAGDGAGRPRHVYRLLLDRLAGSRMGGDRPCE